jgi:hypothetical protein
LFIFYYYIAVQNRSQWPWGLGCELRSAARSLRLWVRIPKARMNVSVLFFCLYCLCRLTTVAARSKAWTTFVRSNSGIVGSNPN